MKRRLILPLLIIILATLIVIFSPTSADLDEAERVEVEVTREVLADIPSSTDAACSLIPSNVILNVEPTSESEATMTLTGLQPGERLVFVFSAEIPGVRQSEIESHPVEEVGVDGYYEFVQTGLYTLDPSNSSPNIWDIKVIHSTGVLCTEVTLP